MLKLLYPDEHGASRTIHDPDNIVGRFSTSIGHLPAFEFEFVQRQSDLVPIQRGVIRTEHPYWEYILQPGHVWKERGEGSWTRAALPFSLQERVANCTLEIRKAPNVFDRTVQPDLIGIRLGYRADVLSGSTLDGKPLGLVFNI